MNRLAIAAVLNLCFVYSVIGQTVFDSPSSERSIPAKPGTPVATQPSEINHLRTIIQATGEDFPKTLTAKWSEFKVDAINKRLGNLHGTKIALDNVRVDEVRKTQTAGNQKFGKWILLSPAEQLSADSTIRVYAYFDDASAERLKLADIAPGSSVDLRGTLVNVQFSRTPKKAWELICGFKCDAVSVPKARSPKK